MCYYYLRPSNKPDKGNCTLRYIHIVTFCTRGRRGRDHMVVGFPLPVQSVPINARRRQTKQAKTTQYVLDATIRKQTQLA